VQPHYIVRHAHGAVETWSVARLPFQPSGWKLQWRDDLKAALRALDAGTGFLSAQYDSPCLHPRCDAENVLFYNLSGAFASSTQHGLRFERGFAARSSPLPLSGVAEHYHQYAPAQPGTAFRGWREERPLAEFSGIELPWIKSDSDPSHVWLALRLAATRCSGAVDDPPQFALRLRLQVPTGAGCAASLAKPLFDGVVSAFQVHDGWRSIQIAHWLSRRLALTPDLLLGLLEESGQAVLGLTRLFDQTQAGRFKWAPDDDYCVAGELAIDRNTDSHTFRLSGTLSAVAPLEAS